jgi:two-component system, LuxR family, response regulator FixJ
LATARPALPVLAPPLAPRSVRPAVVYVVEDDKDLREGLMWILKGAGYRPEPCESGGHALQTIVPRSTGCLLIDLCLPDMNGLELRRRLVEKGCGHPFIVITGSGDISLALESLRAGAIDFLQKPFNRARLLDLVQVGLDRAHKRSQIQNQIDALTDREREILRLVADGRTTKEIAADLDISPRTVDVHRHHILKKMGVHSPVQLVRILNELGQLGA